MSLLTACTPATQQGEDAQALKQEIINLQQQIEGMNEYKPGLIHTVFFWLKPGITEAERQQFLAGVNTLKSIETVRAFHIGVPAETPYREVIDTTYQAALIIHFDDIAGEEAYQVHPTHLAFVENNKQYWTTVKVYDTAVE